MYLTGACVWSRFCYKRDNPTPCGMRTRHTYTYIHTYIHCLRQNRNQSEIVWIAFPLWWMKVWTTRKILNITRSTRRAQTSATPSLKSVKQSTQVWISVAYCFVCPYHENFMNVHPSGIPWCCQQTWTQEIEKGTLCPKSWTDHPQNVPDSSLCHSQHILKISWKFTHRFYRGVAKKHTRGA